MEIKSSAFSNGEKIPRKYTCEGDSISPPLSFSDVPSDSKSLALIMFDPDIPQEFKDKLNIPGWDHWSVWNISSSTLELGEGAVPTGSVQGNHTRGKIGYAPPCPPKDKEPPKHRYEFTLYALDTELDLKEGATRQELLDAMEDHILEKAELMGMYEKEA